MIGGDNISNDVITIGTCFSMFVYILARFRLASDSQKSDISVDGEPRKNWSGIQIPEQALLPFPAPPPERPESLLVGYDYTD